MIEACPYPFGSTAGYAWVQAFKKSGGKQAEPATVAARGRALG